MSGAVVNRLCCSGLDALAAAAAQVTSGMADLVAGGGVESMSRVPMLSDRPSIAFDEELGERTGFVTIGVSADATAKVAGVDRADADAYAFRSHQRAAAAWAAGHFDHSVVPVRDADGEVLLAVDDAIRPKMTPDDFAAMPLLFPDDQAAHDRVGRRLPELGDFPPVHSASVRAADRRRRVARADRHARGRPRSSDGRRGRASSPPPPRPSARRC